MVLFSLIMPPINIKVRVGEKTVSMPDIPPGIPASLSDVDPSSPSVLVVSCNPDDDGGIVYRQKPDDTLEILGRALRIIDGDSGDIEAVIGRNETISIPLHTKFGKAILELRHF